MLKRAKLFRTLKIITSGLVFVPDYNLLMLYIFRWVRPVLQGWSRFHNFFSIYFFHHPRFWAKDWARAFPQPLQSQKLPNNVSCGCITKCEMSPDPCKHKITNHIDNTQGRYRIYRYRNIQQIHPMIDLKFNKKKFLLDYIDGF